MFHLYRDFRDSECRPFSVISAMREGCAEWNAVDTIRVGDWDIYVLAFDQAFPPDDKRECLMRRCVGNLYAHNEVTGQRALMSEDDTCPTELDPTWNGHIYIAGDSRRAMPQPGCWQSDTTSNTNECRNPMPVPFVVLRRNPQMFKCPLLFRGRVRRFMLHRRLSPRAKHTRRQGTCPPPPDNCTLALVAMFCGEPQLRATCSDFDKGIRQVWEPPERAVLSAMRAGSLTAATRMLSQRRMTPALLREIRHLTEQMC